MNTRLRILCEQDYIARNYDSSYKLRAQHASYFLLPKGIKVLKERPDFNPKVLRNIAKDKNASERFVTHSLSIFEIYCQFKRLYGNDLKFFTKSYLALSKFDYFPQPLPDAYVSFKQDEGKEMAKPMHCMLEYFETSLPFFVLRQRIEKLLDYAEDGDWPKNQPFPALLFVCETERLRQRVNTQAKKELDSAWAQGVVLATITTADIVGSNTQTEAVWQRPDKPRAKFNLRSLIVNP